MKDIKIGSYIRLGGREGQVRHEHFLGQTSIRNYLVFWEKTARTIDDESWLALSEFPDLIILDEKPKSEVARERIVVL